MRSLVLVLTLFLLLPSFPLLAAGALGNSVAQAAPVQVDQALYQSSIPPYMVVGQNYTIRLLLTNELNVETSVFVQMQAPLQYMLVKNLTQQVVLPPQQSVLSIFYIVPYSAHVGSMVVTASVLSVNDTSTGNFTLNQIASATTTVQGISLGHQSLSYLVVVLAAVVFVAFVVYAGYTRTRRVNR